MHELLNDRTEMLFFCFLTQLIWQVQDLYFSEDAAAAGVTTVAAYQLWSNPHDDPPWKVRWQLLKRIACGVKGPECMKLQLHAVIYVGVEVVDAMQDVVPHFRHLASKELQPFGAAGAQAETNPKLQHRTSAVSSHVKKNCCRWLSVRTWMVLHNNYLRAEAILVLAF